MPIGGLTEISSRTCVRTVVDAAHLGARTVVAHTPALALALHGPSHRRLQGGATAHRSLPGITETHCRMAEVEVVEPTILSPAQPPNLATLLPATEAEAEVVQAQSRGAGETSRTLGRTVEPLGRATRALCRVAEVVGATPISPTQLRPRPPTQPSPNPSLISARIRSTQCGPSRPQI